MLDVIPSGLRIATPLLLGASGELLLERSGVLNIGLEGVMLCGAFFGFAASFYSGSALVGVLAGILAGALLTAVLGWMVLRVKADPLVTGLALNLSAVGLTGLLFRAMENRLQREGVFLAPSANTFGTLAFGQSWYTWLALMVIPGLWFYLARTERGLELRAVGENPHAAAASGISVRACRFKACLFAGAMGGLAGSFLTLFQASNFAFNCTGGRGFIALSAVVLGRHNPWGVGLACLVFGFAFAAGNQAQAAGVNVSSEILDMLPFAVTLLALAVSLQKRAHAPAALGKPF